MEVGMHQGWAWVDIVEAGSLESERAMAGAGRRGTRELLIHQHK